MSKYPAGGWGRPAGQRQGPPAGNGDGSVVVVGVGAVDLETLVAIAAFDPAGVVPDGQPDARMPQRQRLIAIGKFSTT